MADDAASSKTFLFVERAATAQMDGDVLSLLGIDENIEFFADRPYRDSGTISLQTFIDSWGDGTDSFETDPPNAALVGFVDGETVTLIVELGSPRPIDNGVSYTFKLLDGEAVPQIDDAVVVIDGVEIPIGL